MTKYTKFVAPDGGWGYMIVVALSINLVILSTHNKCYDALYKILFTQLTMNSTSIGLLKNIIVLTSSISGFITCVLLKYFSLRKLALVASILLSLGQLCSAFVQSKTLLFMCQGILQAFGSGVIFNLSYTIVIEYFDKKRLLAIIISQTAAALSLFISPHFIRWSLDYYGSQGTIFFLSAITMNTVLAAILMQPVSTHMKKIVPETKNIEMKILLSDSNKGQFQQRETTQNTNNLEQNKNKTNSFNVPSDDSEYRIFKINLEDFINVTVFRKFLLSIAPLGLSLAGVADGIFMTMLPHALYSMDWNSDEVARALLLVSIGDVTTCIIFLISNKWLRGIGSHEMYVIGLLVAFFTRIGMLWSDNVTVMMTFLTIMGISQCTIRILILLVIVDSVGRENFTFAMGIVMLLSGIMKLVLGPVIGAVRDLTDSYPTAFYILASCFGIVIMFWCIELLYKKNKHKWVIKRGEPEKM